MATSKLAKLLVAPSKIASKLNWQKVNGAVLSLDIHKDRIGMAIASHPTMDDDGAVPLEPIHYHFQGGKLPENVKQRLEEIVEGQNDNICGIVVSWPLQKDTGHMGAACGRTIHVVEELMENTNIFTPSRPLCFWDSEHPAQSDEDEWGRCPEYARTSSKHEHLASIEQYNQDENVVATEVWNDFVRAHWPSIFNQQRRFSEIDRRPHYSDMDDDYYYDDDQSSPHEPSLAF